MPLEDFIINVFCCVDLFFSEIVNKCKLRRSGFPPSLSDPEVITMEIVGEFLKIDTDKGIWEYFSSHWKYWFPGLGSRTAFVKQAANLLQVKQEIQLKLSMKLNAFSDQLHFIDGFPMPICKYARSNQAKLFSMDAAYGYCASKDEKYYGFKGNLAINSIGVISGLTVTAANVDERKSMFDFIDKIKGLLIGDMGFIGDDLQKQLKEEYEINFQTPKRKNMPDDRSPEYVGAMKSMRRLVETVISQLTGRFNIAKVWARDPWHLSNRVTRKILSHTMAIFINSKIGRDPLKFDGLITC